MCAPDPYFINFKRTHDSWTWLKVLGGLQIDKTPTSWSCVPVGETMSNQARLIQTETRVMRIRGNGAELLNYRNAVDRQMDG